MKHMNNKMVKLLHEGFSIDTLEKLNSKQLDTLYNKIFEDDKAVINVKKGSPEEAQAKAAGKAFVTYEEELEEGDEVDVTDVDKGQIDQDPVQKPGPDGMGEGYISEKAVSKQQQKIMGLALSVKKGDTPKSKVSKKVQDMAKEMSKKELEDFASTKHKNLPKKVEASEGEKKFIQKAKKEIEKKGTEGSFKKYCGGEVTMDCIKKGLKSDDPKIVKRANFAKNIGGYKGAEHNEVKNLEESILRIIENHLPPHTTKGELLNYIRRNK